MSDLIDKDRLLALAYWHGPAPTQEDPFPEGTQAVDVADIEKLEGEPGRPPGRWVQLDPGGVYKCSNCGEILVADDIGSYGFCYRCGARLSEPYKEAKMKPCPFCTDERDLLINHETENDGSVWYWVECGFCNSRGPEETTEERAIKAWNGRRSND